MYIIKDYADLENFISETNSGYSMGIYYDFVMDTIHFSKANKIVFNNKALKEKISRQKGFCISSRYLILRKTDISDALISNYISIYKMTPEELDKFNKNLAKTNSFTGTQLSDIMGLSLKQISKASSISIEDLNTKEFYLIELFKIDDYPSPVRLLQYVRKHSTELEVIQMNAYISDCNEIVNEYLSDPSFKGTRRNLDGVYLQLFKKVIEKVIDFKCLMHIRGYMDLFLTDFDKKNFMSCFTIERVILHILEENSKN